jgi:glycosyltransferase involved in cell wall biosynthesis
MKGLRIAVTVDPYLPVPPRLYGGIERVVDLLVRGLVARGHTVTLFAHPESRTLGELVPYGVPPHIGLRARLGELWQVGAALWRRRNEWDVVHSFGRLAALLPILPVRRLPKIQSYQRDGVPWTGIERAVRLAGDSIRFTACSSSVFRSRPERGQHGGRWTTVFNGVDPGKYQFVSEVPRDAPLVFLGRLERIKGVHHAITIATRSARRLVIAGNQVDDPAGRDYFERDIAPHVDGDGVRYIGPVDDVSKSRLLGSAAGLLMPIEWEEPFGIVMAEALACGTPVIAFRRGSASEVVRDGITGYLCDTVEEAVAAVGRLGRLTRTVVRADCEERFSLKAVVDAYEALYRELTADRGVDAMMSRDATAERR